MFPSLGRWRTSRGMAALAYGLLASMSWIPGSSAEDKTAADYFVSSLPGAPEPLLKMHAGHIEVTPEHHGNLFFWLYQNRHIANKQRTVIWLNGGPGCSSMDGAMMEIGPYRVREGGKLEYNNGSWDEFANLLFVDNPVGTGFSYVDTDSYLKELDEMKDQFIVFLEKWFAIFPEYENDDLYFAGESYAGQHIPYIAKGILERNKDASKKKWNLSGLLIGNGWISPVEQYLSYMPFAYENGLLRGGTDSARRVESQLSICTKKLNEGANNYVDTRECEQVMIAILDESKDLKADAMHQCVNMYDVRLRDDSSCGMNWPPDLEHVTPYLQREDVTKALHINKDKTTGWTECAGAVSANFRARHSIPSVQLLPDILAEVPIVLFSGDKDFICNHMGTEAFIDNLNFNGGKGMELSPGVYAPRRDWTFEGEPAGTYQEARNLTYVVFYNSSHMVPFDYPRRTRDMLDRFMGVDISAIGGKPTDSRIDGEKGPLVSVGGHPNSTQAEQDKTKELKEAEWKAYYRSGEVALIVVAIAAGLWGFFVWRDRRRRAALGYKGVSGEEGRESLVAGMGLENFRRSQRRGGDLEAADFDERELDNLDESIGGKKVMNGHGSGNGAAKQRSLQPYNDSNYSLGEASSDGEGSEPRPGDQYRSANVQNPFEERRVSAYTAQEIATLQSRLNKQLGPEFISKRTGAGGGLVAYLAAEKAINLANEVFGFNGWSTSLQQVQVDFVDENRDTGRINLGLSIIVRVTLRDGTYHEDIGYGHIENCKGKAAAFEKAKKEAATDGMKRALRTFGNVLGNCLYDKEYLKKVNNVKATPVKFEADSLHRHPDFAPAVKKEPQKETETEPTRPNQMSRLNTEQSHISAGDFDDEFAGNLFDGVEISEEQGDEFTLLEAASTSSVTEVGEPAPKPNGVAPPRAPEQPNNIPPNRANQGNGVGQPQQSMSRVQSLPAARQPNAVGHSYGPQPQHLHQGNNKPPIQAPNQGRGPPTPNPQQNGMRPDLNRRMLPPTSDTYATTRPPAQEQNQPQNQAAPNQPQRTTPPQQNPYAENQAKAAQLRSELLRNGGVPGPTMANKPPVGVGFVTSRAAEMVQKVDNPNGTLPPNVPAFNPHAESPIPKEKRTPGIDHTKSIKVTREEVGARSLGSQQQQQRPNGAPFARPNFINPQQDANRRIGMPGGAMSPLANRGAYKPPGMVNGIKRPPLTDVSNKGTESGAVEPDAKRVKVNGVESRAVAS
ncbi:alpha/beta-hydrolase [Delitschia confertaspora ATCC 74209]|uniref:Pheromone-processing carboxypeptidase KEX1 n=1 Tax=Delitschia confertaspora ATCC 74209 TaxID=1513339 RepID=A0A9P4MYY7_9PLEO|nr:alpha/beta-hydrolase [Delitschia confertaspora ATCC 74209]